MLAVEGAQYPMHFAIQRQKKKTKSAGFSLYLSKTPVLFQELNDRMEILEENIAGGILMILSQYFFFIVYKQWLEFKA